MSKFLAAPLVALGLASCAQYEAQQAAQAQAAAQAQSDADAAQCQSYGAPVGSPAYVQCRMNLDNQHQADLMQRRAIATSIILGR